uniref:hypothetical protein n=1 Tax=Endozoicomonas sp. ONNA2 TaxID=2828741 RepID=UPI0021498F64
MNLSQLNGVTPEQLHKFIMKFPIGFSAEARSIQYLGRQIQLHDGITVLSEQTVNTVGSQQLFERMIRLQPELERQLPGLKSEAINMAARHLVAEFNAEAIEKSPTKEVLCAVFLECMRPDVLGVIDTVIELSNTHALSGTEKLPIMLAAEKKRQCGIPMFFWRSAGIPLAIRLEEAKNQFQRLPAGPSLSEKAEKIAINEGLTGLAPGKPVKDSLLEIRQILESENNELARQLLSEVDNIEKKFFPRVKESGHLFINDKGNFIIYTQRLLYLYAACFGFSPEANIAELASYIRSILSSADSGSIWHIAKELVYLS